MKTISPRLRRRIDAVAAELSGIAETLAPDFPGLAAMYLSLGGAIDGSHYCLHGMHDLSFAVPHACRASVMSAGDGYGKDHVMVFLSVPLRPANRSPTEREAADA